VDEEFIVSKPASQLRPGDRFIFTEEMGGEGEVLTVKGVGADTFGTMEIETEELDFNLDVLTHQWMQIAPEEDVRGCSCGMADYGAPGHDGHDG
jgi:hypothetical protein